MITNKNLFNARIERINAAKEASKSNPFGQTLILDDSTSREFFKFKDGQICEYEMSNYLIEKCVENRFAGGIISRKKVNVVALTDEEKAVADSGILEEITED